MDGANAEWPFGFVQIVAVKASTAAVIITKFYHTFYCRYTQTHTHSAVWGQRSETKLTWPIKIVVHGFNRTMKLCHTPHNIYISLYLSLCIYAHTHTKASCVRLRNISRWVFTLYLSFNELLTILNAVATYVIYCGKLKLKQKPPEYASLLHLASTAEREG